MTKAIDVLNMLIPQGGWYMVGEEYEGIQFIECEPITKQQFLDGFKEYEEQQASRKATAEAKLAALGLTTGDLKALGLGGN
jgi:hypothetical protein